MEMRHDYILDVGRLVAVEPDLLIDDLRATAADFDELRSGLLRTHGRESPGRGFVLAHASVLGHEQNLDAAQSLDMTAQMHDREVARYLESEQRVRVRAGPALHRYLDDLRFWMSGNLRWSRSTGRYRHPADTVVDSPPGPLTSATCASGAYSR